MNAPDARGWLLICLGSLLVFELLLKALVPELRNDETLKWLIEGTWQGGIAVGVGFYFVASKKDPDAK